MARKVIDETGNTYGPFEVKKFVGTVATENGTKATWVCVCKVCGIIKVISGVELRSKDQLRSCRCARKKRDKSERLDFIKKLRARGETWKSIGSYLGISWQAVYQSAKRYGLV